MKKRVISLLVVLLGLFVLSSCTTTSKVEYIDFKNIPDATYELGKVVYASEFYVTVKVEGSDPVDYRLTNSALTVEGLLNGKLDTSTPGEKVIKVTYKGSSVSAYYTVVGTSEAKSWSHESTHKAYVISDNIVNISEAGQLAKLAAEVNNGNEDLVGVTVKLTANIDLENARWTSIGTKENSFKGSFDGNGFTISNLKIDVAPGNVVNVGLFGYVYGGTYKNVNINGVNIDIISGNPKEYSKNFAALIGNSNGEVTIENVKVNEAYLRGNGRIAALIGQQNGVTTITDSKISNSTFIAYNPVYQVNEDGEGDKVGALVGQSQAELTLERNKVNNVSLTGTRDVGGLVGHASNNTTAENNIVDANTYINATALGGFKEGKVSANAGGLFGTINPGKKYVLNGNQVKTSNYIADSLRGSSGKFVGGFRRDVEPKGGKLLFDVTGNNVIEVEEKPYYSDEIKNVVTEKFIDFLEWQDEVFNLLGLK